jgi:4-hydroxy-tetrahydrodipicolinate synthase
LNINEGKMPKKFRGVFAVTCTPFDQRGEFDSYALGRHLNWLLEEGVHGVIPAGSTGEFAFLSPEERRKVVETALKVVDGRVPVLAGTAACSTRETIRLTQEAQQLGAGGVMVVPPYYGRLSQEELYAHYAALADGISIPIMIYNNPGASGSDILPATLARLAPHPNIAALKESTGQMQRVHEVQDLCGDRIEVLCGCDTLPLEMFALGVEGWVAAPSNTIPRECVRLFQLAVEERDFDSARALYRRLLPLFDLFERSGQYVQLNKAALELLGRPLGDPRPPLLPASPELRLQLKEILAGLAG